jgi:hypothetical protein
MGVEEQGCEEEGGRPSSRLSKHERRGISPVVRRSYSYVQRGGVDPTCHPVTCQRRGGVFPTRRLAGKLFISRMMLGPRPRQRVFTTRRLFVPAPT